MADSKSSDVNHAAEATLMKSKPFGRTKSVGELLGGGKVASILLWKDLKTSGFIILSVITLWYFFERSGLNLITLAADFLMIAVSAIFIWAQVASFLNKSGPPLFELKLSDDAISSTAALIRNELNKLLKLAHSVALGKDYLLFGKVMAALYVISVIGGYFHFLTLVLIAFIGAFTFPVIYDKFEDKVDAHLEKIISELEKFLKLAEEKIRSVLNRPKSKKNE